MHVIEPHKTSLFLRFFLRLLTFSCFLTLRVHSRYHSSLLLGEYSTMMLHTRLCTYVSSSRCIIASHALSHASLSSCALSLPLIVTPSTYTLTRTIETP